jgi:hypothetical protein
VSVHETLAVCPVCTVAVIGGLGLSRYFGIDDAISGLWVGGLMISLTFWTATWLKKENWKLLILLFYILITYVPLYWAGIIGHPFNQIWGIDKLIFGSVFGAVAFLFGVFLDKKVREIKGKQLFQFQKVVFPFAALVISSLIFYILIK